VCPNSPKETREMLKKIILKVSSRQNIFHKIMIAKKTLKYIKSLQLKKYRKIENSFLVEGAKSVIELLNSDFTIRTLFATEVFLNSHKQLIDTKNIQISVVSEQDLAAAGSYKTNDAAIAIVAMKENKPVKGDEGLTLVLDDIRDPGNLGTIARIADWYGINNIVCSLECADQYNPKVIAASMGSFTRVNFYYTNLQEYLSNSKLPKYGAYLEGQSVHDCAFDGHGLLVMGNESNGINPNLEKLIDARINIPGFGRAESLNVAIATAVICDNFRRIEKGTES